MNGWMRNFHWQDAALPCFAVVCVLALLFRLPTGLMDFLLSVNLALSAAIFLSTFFVRKPLEFSSFPTILLTTTLFRLVLNVSTTRLILTQGDAGKVVDAFSKFVAGDNIVVGGVVFLIFIIIQFVVITKGATRISEVSARFTLDAMPGKQAAIDFDLNAGNITDVEAKRARAELSEQADFFGAMDGASKFVRGDAVAGLAIVAINLIGGLAIGVAQRHMSIADASSLYSKLTIGDGLVSQISAFLISLATGLLVARSSRPQNVSNVAIKQTFGRPIVLAITGAFLAVMTFTGMPVLPLVTLACGCFALAWALGKKNSEDNDSLPEHEGESRGQGVELAKKNSEDDDLEKYLDVDPLTLEIGPGLIPLAQPEEGLTLLDRVKTVRQTVAVELGMVLPKVRIRDDSALDDDQFTIKIAGEETALDVAHPGMALAIETDYSVGTPNGLQTKAPNSNAKAFWISESDVEKAKDDGFDVIGPGDVIERKMIEVAIREAANLLTRDATKRLIERLRTTAPALVEETLGDSGSDARRSNAKLAKIQRVLQLLLNERVSIRRLDLVLEAIGDLDFREPDADVYRALEYVRVRMARIISAMYRDEDGLLRVIMFDPETEDALRGALAVMPSGEPACALFGKDSADLNKAVARAVESLREYGSRPVLLVDKSMRYAIRETLRSKNPDLVFLAFEEIDDSTKVQQGAVVDWKPPKK